MEQRIHYCDLKGDWEWNLRNARIHREDNWERWFGNANMDRRIILGLVRAGYIFGVWLHASAVRRR